MKSILFTVSFFFSFCAIAQPIILTDLNGNYQWNTPIPITECNIKGDPIDQPGQIFSEVNQQFIVIGREADTVIFKVVDYTIVNDIEPHLQGNNIPVTRFFQYNFNGTVDEYNALTMEERNKRDYGDKQRYFSVLQSELTHANQGAFIVSYSQESLIRNANDVSSELNGPYKWANPILMTESYIDGTIKQPTKLVLSEIGQEFSVIGSTGNGFAIIKIYNYLKENQLPTSNFYKYNYDLTIFPYSDLSNETKNHVEYGNAQKYFLVSEDDLTKNAIKNGTIGASMEFGLLNLPFRFRPQIERQDFSGTFNLSGAIGLKIKHKEWRKYTLSIVGSYGISNVTLDSASVSSNHEFLTATNSFTALSLAIGGLIEFENVQAGIFLGMDRINRQNQQTFGWRYQGNPWLSIGFGYSIFSVEKEPRQETTDKKVQPSKLL